MNDRLMDALAGWNGDVKFGGRYDPIKEELEAELGRKRGILGEPSKIKIRPNDFVRHIPSGEEWVVCGVNYERDELIPCGYPFPSLAKLSDCVLSESRRLQQDDDMKKALVGAGLPSFIEVEV